MLDVSHIPQDKISIYQEFTCNSPSAGASWHTWVKPRSVTMVHFFVLGGAGAGGAGAAGGASAGAGGGGGGSSAQCSIMFPAWALPDIIYISVGVGGIGGSGIGGAGVASYVSVQPAVTPVNYLMCRASGGAGGGAAAAGTAGALGAAGVVTAIANCPLAGLGFPTWGTAATNVSLVGQPGIIGGAAVAGGPLTLPVTGLLVTGGTGGAGRGANNAVGAAGGTITSIGTPAGAVFPIQAGGIGGVANTNPGSDGSNGFRVKPNMLFFYGGTGGGSGGANQVAAGLQGGGNGGRGAFGSGGGGGGGCATGSVPGTGGYGGDGLVVVTAW